MDQSQQSNQISVNDMSGEIEKKVKLNNRLLILAAIMVTALCGWMTLYIVIMLLWIASDSKHTSIHELLTSFSDPETYMVFFYLVPIYIFFVAWYYYANHKTRLSIKWTIITIISAPLPLLFQWYLEVLSK